MSGRTLAQAGTGLTILLIVTGFSAGATSRQQSRSSGAFAVVAPTAGGADRLRSGTGLAVPAALFDGALGLRAGPVEVPLELIMPSIDATAAVVGVGMTPSNVMDAPMGPAEDPVWQQAFWYRGSAVPGAPSTALIAGHVNDSLGRPAAFAHIDDLRPGDPIVVHDTRSGLDVDYSVTDSQSYPLDQTGDPAVLAQIYGAGPVAGTEAQPSADGLSHLTLITCAGTFRNGTHDHRLVVYATRNP